MFQETMIVGIVTEIGELKYQPNGEAWKLFRVETIRMFKDFTGQVKREKIYWRVNAWNKWASWAERNIRQGMYVQVRGRLHADETTGGPVVRYNQKTVKHTASFDLVAREIMPWGGASLDMEHLPIEEDEYDLLSSTPAGTNGAAHE